MSALEFLGKISGYIMGTLTGAISFLRASRMFHPRGLLYEAKVTSKEFPPHAMVRLSSAIWKDKEWIDVLGISLRFKGTPVKGITLEAGDQDLLFATISSPLFLFVAPFLTRFSDFLRNDYFAVGWFEVQQERVKFKLVPKNTLYSKGTRRERLEEAVMSGEAVLILQKQVKGSKIWRQVAEIKLVRSLHFDQEALRFHPFNQGLNIKPRGYLQYLRIGTYNLSQWCRPEWDMPP